MTWFLARLPSTRGLSRASFLLGDDLAVQRPCSALQPAPLILSFLPLVAGHPGRWGQGGGDEEEKLHADTSDRRDFLEVCAEMTAELHYLPQSWV